MEGRKSERYCDRVIAEFFSDPPYVLRSGETVTAEDYRAIYDYLELSAALDGNYQELTPAQSRAWTRNRIERLYRDAKTYEQAVQDFENVPEEFKKYAIKNIPQDNFQSYADGTRSDYRFATWASCMMENWELSEDRKLAEQEQQEDEEDTPPDPSPEETDVPITVEDLPANEFIEEFRTWKEAVDTFTTFTDEGLVAIRELLLESGERPAFDPADICENYVEFEDWELIDTWGEEFDRAEFGSEESYLAALLDSAVRNAEASASRVVPTGAGTHIIVW